MSLLGIDLFLEGSSVIWVPQVWNSWLLFKVETASTNQFYRMVVNQIFWFATFWYFGLSVTL